MAEPIRTCLGCGKKQPKRAFHRVCLKISAVVADQSQTAPGRGAYLCGAGCVRAAVKKRAFQRAFRTKVELDVTNLEAALQSA